MNTILLSHAERWLEISLHCKGCNLILLLFYCRFISQTMHSSTDLLFGSSWVIKDIALLNKFLLFS
jgi:hypothetical protein